MASQTYSAGDLLRLRYAPAPKAMYEQLYLKLRKDVELGDVIRVAPERALPLIREEINDVSEDSNDNCPQVQVSVRQLDGTDSDWKYRGRTDSEHTDTNPISAPPTLAAQRDEGFQRFYKAVVSPTHVRVTAGGRIVPNKRGSSSPTAKWTREKPSEDSTPRPASHGPPEFQGYPVAQTPYGPFSPMYPGFVPGMPPGMAPGPPPFPMVPWPMGYNMAGSIGMAPFPPAQAHLSPMAASDSKEMSKSRKQGDSDSHESPGNVSVPPADHFDRSRPFFYNGQWMMPPPPAHPFYPFGFPQFHGFAAPPGMTGPMLPPHGFPMNPKPPVTTAKNGQPAQTQHGSSGSVASIASFVPPSKPPISSIRPSEITRKQVEVLRGSLKYLEDQLQYNKHQIDEKGMENQAQMVRQQIQQFEKNLEAQLNFEKAHYPGNDSKEETASQVSSGAGTKSKSSAKEATHDSSKPKSHGKSQDDASQTRKDSSSKTKDSGSSDAVEPVPFPTVKKLSAKLSNNSGAAKRVNSLPFTAALAPPFQPRFECTTPTEEVESYFPEYGLRESDLNNLQRPDHSFSGFRSLRGSRQSTSDGTNSGLPYLVGQLPRGINPRSIKDTDYTYVRELTEDELRARHMYWGKAPRHLQKGLPKFDGKDFYPPSPVKGSTLDPSMGPTSSNRSLPVREAGARYTLNTAATEADPFQFLTEPGRRVSRDGPGKSTQSESLPPPEESVSDVPADIQRSGSCIIQVSPNYENFRKAMADSIRVSSSSGSKGKTSSDEGDDDRNLLFKGRKALGRTGTKTHNDIWQSMMKKGKSSSNVAPGAVTSMTAQGVLPHYSGHATASLTPTMVNTSPRHGALKPGDVIDEEDASHVPEKRGENTPPSNPIKASLRKAGRPDSRRGMISR